ncbi:Adaptive-response sensory-kinase SasA [subsurface metagenome]
MRLWQSSNTSVGLIVLVLIFILLIGLIVVFSQVLLSNLARADAVSNIVVILVAVMLPLILLGIIIYHIIRLIQDRARQKPGARFKTRLLLFFVFVSLLASIPQALLSISFINSTINFWLEARIGEALRGGLSISLEYYHGMVENLNSFSKSSLLPYILRDLERNHDRLWKNIQTTNAQVHFVQVFSEEGEEILYRGDRTGRLADYNTIKNFSGSLPKEDRKSLSIIRNLSEHSILGRTYHVVVGMVLAEGFDEKAKHITESLETFNQLNRYKRLFNLVLISFYFLVSFPIFLLSIMISFLLTEEIIQPIVNLEEATRRVAEGDFSFRILTRSEDEFSVLVGSFNRMVSELSQSRKKLVQAEKISAWQDIAQRLAHEIKNPLTPIKLSAQRILKKFNHSREEFEQIIEPAVSAIIQEVDNLNNLLLEFSELARLPGPKLEKTKVKSLVEDVASIYTNLSGSVHIDCSLINPDIELQVDRNQMKQVFANLFKNAIQAMPEGGDILVRSDIVNKENRNFCRIWIKDRGSGIDEEVKDFVFNPYFTTKKEGTGLGLSIVERVIFDHNGAIWFETQKGIGTTFIIDLPVE